MPHTNASHQYLTIPTMHYRYNAGRESEVADCRPEPNHDPILCIDRPTMV